MNKTLVFGGSGQLGQCLQHVAQQRNFTDIVFLPEEQANILNPDVLRATFEQHRRPTSSTAPPTRPSIRPRTRWKLPGR